MPHIPFNVPPYVGGEETYIREVIQNRKLCGDGPMTRACSQWLERRMGTEKVLLTTSGSHALDMAALLLDIRPGDEVIMPSYTFSSTANAFALRGATIVFVDVRPDTMNIDETLIEDAITPRTKAIVPMHYAGVACEMDTILAIGGRHNIPVVEDAAQAVLGSYKGRMLGAIGQLGCYSFHESKNYSMGEGGALLINDPAYIERAEMLREKGTNRTKFLLGQVDKYTWVDIGSSFLPSELNAAYLRAQLDRADEINQDRLASWDLYYQLLLPLKRAGKLDLPVVPEGCRHNAHMFFIKTRDLAERTALTAFLKENGIGAMFHYVPLHSSPAGLRFGRFCGKDVFTTREFERLLRLPMYYGLPADDVARVAEAVGRFYR